MSELSLMKSVEVLQVITPTNGVAAQTAINSTEVDMQGFESVTFVVGIGVVTAGAVTTLKAQQDTVTGMASAADLLGTSVVVNDDDDDQLKYLEIVRPLERFVRLVVSRATQDAVITHALAIKTKARKMPTTQPALTEGEVHVSPAEGTA